MWHPRRILTKPIQTLAEQTRNAILFVSCIVLCLWLTMTTLSTDGDTTCSSTKKQYTWGSCTPVQKLVGKVTEFVVRRSRGWTAEFKGSLEGLVLGSFNVTHAILVEFNRTFVDTDSTLVQRHAMKKCSNNYLRAWGTNVGSWWSDRRSSGWVLAWKTRFLFDLDWDIEMKRCCVYLLTLWVSYESKIGR